ncbi:hypothetical protein FGG08_004524 [Glutinoglossum americanum]|uniref:Uncharacterized protein n=1 Tax=Glutinoglossum americanum TaxID=1670608 RepID=A0A9P8KZH1_9PEZI|nr:hypothetical protein FGG08_004524 [Glutinoglossum americanum]
MRPLTYHQSVACVKISRQTLITFILLSQARQIYRYSSAAGLRLAYAGYNGSYQIEWPLGGRPVMTFAPHQGISREKDNYPEVFARRPRKCIEMGLGVISFTDSDANDKTKIAFAGRKPPGRWVLERLQNRFSAQRTAADQYNEMGGQAHEVDYLFRRRLEKDDPEPPHALKLSVPSLEDDEESILYLAQEEVVLVASCLDHLPWSPLAWSIHRGMKDVLVAYGKQTMKAYRNDLAEFLRQAVKGKEQVLADQGWPRKFAEDYMASQAASAILGDEECSGDVCRIVSAVALLEWDKDEASLDQTTFWRSNVHVLIEDDETQTRKLTPDMVIALVKLFFVQWSHEFNYGMCFDIPYELTLS